MPHLSPRGQRNNPVLIQVARVQLVAAAEETQIVFGTSCGWNDFATDDWCGFVYMEDENSIAASTCHISYRTTTQVTLQHTATAATGQYVSILGIGV